MSMNVHIVSGFVGKDPEVKDGKNAKYGRFSVATDSYVGKDKKGNAQYDTVWHNIEVFDSTAEYVEKHIKKGDYVEVVGEHRVDVVGEGKDKQYYHKIRAMRVQKVFLKGKDKDESAEEGGGDEGQQEPEEKPAKSKAAAAGSSKSKGKSEDEGSDDGGGSDFPF